MILFIAIKMSFHKFTGRLNGKLRAPRGWALSGTDSQRQLKFRSEIRAAKRLDMLSRRNSSLEKKSRQVKLLL